MTKPLSPAAKAVMDAFLVVDDARHAIAAALRAAVDQTFPDERDIETELIRSDLLAIAEALARWGRQPAPHDDRGVLPMIVSDTGASDEPERERIICASISGGADYINNMPRMLILERINSEGSTYQQYIQEPTPPAEGEVAAITRLIPLVIDRAAELLQQQEAEIKRLRAQQTPVPVSERLPGAADIHFEFVVSDADYCTQAGGVAPTYAQALSEGQRYLAQYQQDGPHTLELRRVEVLHPGALPVHPTPVPVSERLPGPEEMDGSLVWCGSQAAGLPYWEWCLDDIRHPGSSGYTHWLPANTPALPTALPLPQGEVK